MAAAPAPRRRRRNPGIFGGSGLVGTVTRGAAFGSSVWLGDFLTAAVKARIPGLQAARFDLVQIGVGLAGGWAIQKFAPRALRRWGKPFAEANVGIGLLNMLTFGAGAMLPSGSEAAQRLGLAGYYGDGGMGDFMIDQAAQPVPLGAVDGVSGYLTNEGYAGAPAYVSG